MHRNKLGKLHISLCSLLFALKTDCSFSLVAKIFIEKAKSEKLSYHFSLHFRNFHHIIAVNLERKISLHYSFLVGKFIFPFFIFPKREIVVKFIISQRIKHLFFVDLMHIVSFFSFTLRGMKRKN